MKHRKGPAGPRWFALAALAATAVAGCGSDDTASSAQSAGPIKLGMIQVLSGPAAAAGTAERNGFELAVERVNASGGIAGRKIEVVAQDSAFDPNKAVSAYRRLSDDQDIVAIFGPTTGTEAQAMAPIVQRGDVPVVAGVSSAIDDRYLDNLFISAPKIELEGEFLVDKLVELGHSRVGMLSTTDALGKDFAAAIKADGRVQVVAEETMPVDVKDVTPQLTKLRSNDPEAVVLIGSPPNAGLAVKAAGELGLRVPIISGPPALSPDNLTAAGESRALKSWRIRGYVDPENPSPEQADGVKALTEAFPDDPLLFTSAGWDCAQILLQGLRNAGKDISRESLMAGLEKVETNGVGGTYRFTRDEHYGRQKGTSPWFVPDGKRFVAEKNGS